jgi:hypothetical protein
MMIYFKVLHIKKVKERVVSMVESHSEDIKAVVVSLYSICLSKAQIDPYAIFASFSSSQNEGKAKLLR